MFLLCAFSTHLAAQPLPARAAQLADAEREFAAAGARDGVQHAFLAHFAQGSVVLRPFATSAREWYQAHADRPGKLIWGPQYVAVSGAGDLGLSIGPWRHEGERDGKRVIAHGHFLSIWRRDASGRWQVVFDHGISHDAAAAVTVEETPLIALNIPAARLASAAVTGARRKALEDADTALRDRLGKNSSDAYAKAANRKTLWLREGSMPAQGAAPPAGAGNHACGCGPRVKLDLAESGDLGYTIGGSEDVRDKGADIRVWTFDPQRGWLLLADLAAAGARL